MGKLTTQDFIKKAKQIHGNKYDYSKVNYVNATTNVIIMCPIHGEFEQMACRHLIGNGCPKCAIEKRKKSSKHKKNTDEFVKECIEKYGNKYDYSKVEYVNAHTPICIIEKSTNKELSVTPTTLLTKGIGDKRGWVNTDKWIERAKKIHGNKYDYSNTEYISSKKKIKFTCHKHGEVEQLPENHIKYGCRFCSYENNAQKRTKKVEKFIEECKKVHGNRYDYSKINYVNEKTEVCIICSKHGEFWQKPIKHLGGQGCPKCKNSRLEEEMMLYLDTNKVLYIMQYSPNFLKNGKGKQKLDFFLPEYNVAIECQGIQHFSPSRFSALSNVEKNKVRDKIKLNKCKENGIKILYYTTKENMKFKLNNDIYDNSNLYCDINETINRLREVL